MSEPLTTAGEGFHPHLHTTEEDRPAAPLHTRLHHIRA
ncbi:cupin, partial [Streptomyces sp. SID7982]|nr:cupin [Streptomyces sp. SID7982]